MADLAVMKSGRETCPTVPGVEILKQVLETSDLVLRGKTDILYSVLTIILNLLCTRGTLSKRDKAPTTGIFNNFILINCIDFKVLKRLTQDIVRYSD